MGDLITFLGKPYLNIHLSVTENSNMAALKGKVLKIEPFKLLDNTSPSEADSVRYVSCGITFL